MIPSTKATRLTPKEEQDLRARKRKTIWAYLDGKKLVDVVQAALENNMHVTDLKKLLVDENPV
jgi:hypothetical protein